MRPSEAPSSRYKESGKPVPTLPSRIFTYTTTAVGPIIDKMLPNGITFSAALLELGHVERSPYNVSLSNSADVSYATSSINGPEELPIELTPLPSAGQLVKASDAAKGLDQSKGTGAIEGLPKAVEQEGGDGAYGDVIVAFEMPEEREDRYDCLGVPAISKRDVQVSILFPCDMLTCTVTQNRS